MTAAIDLFLAAVRSHPVIAKAIADDDALAAHLTAFEAGLDEIGRSCDPQVIAAHDEIAEIVRYGVSKKTMFAIARVMQGLQSCRH